MSPARIREWKVSLGVAAALTLLSCGITDSGKQSARIVLDVRSLLGAEQGDYTTVAERVDLSITSGGEVQTQSQALPEAESSASFDVEVNTGSVTFAAGVVSNNATTLYQGTTTTTIEEDGFQVTVPMVAVSPVLLLEPRVGTFVRDTLESDSRLFLGFMRVRNPGLDSLRWSADPQVPLPPGVTTFCRLPQHDGVSCNVERATAGGESEIIELFVDVPFGIPLPASVTLRILSRVGNLPVPATLPAPPPG